LSSEEKKTLIKRATTQGKISLLTKSFGRGTDFVCTDVSINNNGGGHVICTYFPEEYSEEV